MLSFHGEQCLKDAVAARVKEHQLLDQIIQGTYWDGVKGCAIGCLLHSDDHMEYERQLGLPVFLAYMDEHIFERMNVEDSKGWPLRFIEAVPVGVDLEMVFPRFTHWLLSDPMGIRRHADAHTLPIIETITKMYADRLNGIPFDTAAAWAAARAAWVAAGVAWAAGAAAGAARAVAEAAVAAAGADGVAGAAAGVARAAAEAAVAAAVAARAAWVADGVAWAAEAAEAAGAVAEAAVAVAEAAVAVAGAAGVAEIHRQADMLISIVQSYESKPVMVYAPCEERSILFHDVRG